MFSQRITNVSVSQSVAISSHQSSVHGWFQNLSQYTSGHIRTHPKGRLHHLPTQTRCPHLVLLFPQDASRLINATSIGATGRSSKRCPHGAKGTQLFLHIRHLHPAPNPRLYLLAAPYLSFEGFNLVFCGYDVDMGLSVAIELSSDSPR